MTQLVESWLSNPDLSVFDEDIIHLSAFSSFAQTALQNINKLGDWRLQITVTKLCFLLGSLISTVHTQLRRSLSKLSNDKLLMDAFSTIQLQTLDRDAQSFVASVNTHPALASTRNVFLYTVVATFPRRTFGKASISCSLHSISLSFPSYRDSYAFGCTVEATSIHSIVLYPHKSAVHLIVHPLPSDLVSLFSSAPNRQNEPTHEAIQFEFLKRAEYQSFVRTLVESWKKEGRIRVEESQTEPSTISALSPKSTVQTRSDNPPGFLLTDNIPLSSLFHNAPPAPVDPPQNEQLDTTQLHPRRVKVSSASTLEQLGQHRKQMHTEQKRFHLTESLEEPTFLHGTNLSPNKLVTILSGQTETNTGHPQDGYQEIDQNTQNLLLESTQTEFSTPILSIGLNLLDPAPSYLTTRDDDRVKHYERKMEQQWETHHSPSASSDRRFDGVDVVGSPIPSSTDRDITSSVAVANTTETSNQPPVHDDTTHSPRQRTFKRRKPFSAFLPNVTKVDEPPLSVQASKPPSPESAHTVASQHSPKVHKSTTPLSTSQAHTENESLHFDFVPQNKNRKPTIEFDDFDETPKQDPPQPHPKPLRPKQKSKPVKRSKKAQSGNRITDFFRVGESRFTGQTPLFNETRPEPPTFPLKDVSQLQKSSSPKVIRPRTRAKQTRRRTRSPNIVQTAVNDEPPEHFENDKPLEVHDEPSPIRKRKRRSPTRSTSTPNFRAIQQPRRVEIEIIQGESQLNPPPMSKVSVATIPQGANIEPIETDLSSNLGNNDIQTQFIQERQEDDAHGTILHTSDGINQTTKRVNGFVDPLFQMIEQSINLHFQSMMDDMHSLKQQVNDQLYKLLPFEHEE
ncbi:hypothetical protein BLNAU_7303 [Blattamonas nauphoetae]|uniref:Uncharacterized protein n=1 Tax=Blattamonas nauphoetae TaxID=2049346 RepID=A0ABQ9Y1M9_9EUKA|nr:hypothetical protein BLNAU_7303 [Blattamonas nauphoetae]